MPQAKRPTQASNLNMNPLPTWEKLLLGVLALLVILWVFPGIKALMAQAQAQDAPRDWQSLIFPLLAVIAFVILLIFLV